MAVNVEDILGGLAPEMARTPQNPRWHGEGDVLTHTRRVCEALTKLEAFRSMDEDTQKILYFAAALHDIGKIRTTRLEDGQWVSNGHTRVGAEMARKLLWQEHDLCGTPEKQRIREAVCNLVRYHSVPAYAITNPDGALTLRNIAANGELIPGFNIELLCILAQADARGRVCSDLEDMLEQIQLCRELAKEARCLEGPYEFLSNHTDLPIFQGRMCSLTSCFTTIPGAR